MWYYNVLKIVNKYPFNAKMIFSNCGSPDQSIGHIYISVNNKELLYLFYFIYFMTHAMEVVIYKDDFHNIDYLYFLHWINSASMENLQKMLEHVNNNTLVYSLRGICLYSNWRHSDWFKQVVTSLSVVRYTTVARLPVRE